MKSIITILFQNNNFCLMYKSEITPLYLSSSYSSSSSEAGGNNLFLLFKENIHRQFRWACPAARF
jgi:hypothetical protein